MLRCKMRQTTNDLRSAMQWVAECARRGDAMTPETNQAVIEFVRLFSVGILGVIIGSYVTHRLTRRRERDKRKREFRSFIVHFKSEAADPRYRYPRDFALFYRNKVPALRQAAVMIADDFPRKRRAQLDGLVSTAASFTGAEADADARKRVIASLDEIFRFLDSCTNQAMSKRNGKDKGAERPPNVKKRNYWALGLAMPTVCFLFGAVVMIQHHDYATATLFGLVAVACAQMTISCFRVED